MNLFEIINMSDAYTIDCPDLDIAFAACVLLGNGQYAFEPLDSNSLSSVPIFIFGGHDEWCHMHCGGATADDVLARVMNTRKTDLADALDSVLIGSARDRAVFDAMVADMTPDQRVKARVAWHDKKLSSMNNIGQRAYGAATALRVGKAEMSAAPQQVFGK